MSRLARRTATTTLALVAAGAATLAAVPARADGNGAPVTAPDRITVREDEIGILDILANDTDPDGDRLEVCRLGRFPRGVDVQRGAELGEEEAPGVTSVFSERPGTFTVTYYACDLEHLTPGTLTITVTKAPKVKVRVTKMRRPGRIRVTNASGFPVRFAWGSALDGVTDGTRVVRRDPVVVIVRRRSISWSAVGRDRWAQGFVRGIRLPRGADLPPGAPPR